MEIDDEYWMRQALQQAQQAELKGEVPVGAILVDQQNQLVSAAHNQPISACDPTAHAEIVVMRDAAHKLANYRLVDTTLFVTLEPCSMCIGAMIHARVKRLVYGATEPRAGAVESAAKLLDEMPYNHHIEVTSGILRDQCASILSEFFARKREK